MIDIPTINYAPAPYIVFSTVPVLLRICSDVEEANIPDDILPASPVVTSVPVTFGMVIVLSAVGSATVTVVSNASFDDPSNIMVPFVVILIPDVVTAPVIGPVNALTNSLCSHQNT